MSLFKEKKSLDIMIKVKRNGNLVNINIRDVVVGDIVYLESGDLVPADGVVVFGVVSAAGSTIVGIESLALKASTALLVALTSGVLKTTDLKPVIEPKAPPIIVSSTHSLIV